MKTIQPGLRVLVTAGASGIGWAIAVALLEDGARVHVCDASSEQLDLAEKEKPFEMPVLCPTHTSCCDPSDLRLGLEASEFVLI